MDDILKSTKWNRGEKQDVLRTYLRLHKGKLGAHWLWCVIEQIANGVPEKDALSDYGYQPSATTEEV